MFKNEKKIVISGLAPVSSLGIGKRKFWNSLLAKKINISNEKLSINNEFWDEYYYHKLDDFDFNEIDGLEEIKSDETFSRQFCSNNYDFLYLLASAKLALNDSKLNIKKLNKEI